MQAITRHVKSCKETVRTHQLLIWMRRNAYEPTFPNTARVQKILHYVTQNLHRNDLKIMTIIRDLILIIIIIIISIFASASNNLTRPEFDLMTTCVGLQHARQRTKLVICVKIYPHYYNSTTQTAGVSSVPFVSLSHLKSFIATWHNEWTSPIRFTHGELFAGTDETLI